MSTYCSHCGAEVEDSTRFCSQCGKPLKQVQVQKTVASSPSQSTSSSTIAYSQGQEFGFVPTYSGTVAQRNYWNYFLISISSVIFLVGSVIMLAYLDWGRRLFGTVISICILLGMIGAGTMLVYRYRNFDDYRKMVRKYHPADHLTPYPPWMMILLSFFHEGVTIYFKYSQLYDHMAKTHRERYQTLPPSQKMVILALFSPLVLLPLVILGSIIFSWTFFLLWPLVSILSGIILIYFENRWQVVFNEHVRYHEAVAAGLLEGNEWLVAPPSYIK